MLDPLDFAGESGTVFISPEDTLVGRGETVRMEIGGGDHLVAYAGIRAALASMKSNGDESVPVAFVTIPFAESESVTAIIPQATLRIDANGKRTMCNTADPDSSVGQNSAPQRASSYSVQSGMSAKAWCDAVREAVHAITDGLVDKVVLARDIVVEADVPFSQTLVASRLCQSFPTAYVFAVDGFVGASPELLIRRRGFDIWSHPLAGTVPRLGDPIADSERRAGLLASTKERSEHAYLVKAVRDGLASLCEQLHVPNAPEVMSLSNVHHLGTQISARLASSSTDALDLVAALHPTPAVGGSPRKAAIELISELEDFDRQRYAGAVGWIDGNGDGCFAVAVRCAQLDGCRARLWAGGGVVADSDPLHELEETEAKFLAMLNALVRP